MIEDQRGLPSFHGCGDELYDYKAYLINSHALRDPGMWYTVKSLLVVSPVCRQILFSGPAVFKYHFVNQELVFAAIAFSLTSLLFRWKELMRA